jgi:hypothetical protein
MMSDSSPSLATGSHSEPATGLVLRPLFKSRPSGVVFGNFQTHVDATGSPETFEWISTTRPPAEGQLSVLGEFSAQKGKRLRGDYVPCPICSPAAPQYLHGLLIWCELTRGIYAIGMDCGHSLDREGRLDRALVAYDRQRSRRRLEDQLLEHLPQVPAVRHWIEIHRPAAIAADRLSRGFRKGVPRIYVVAKQAFTRNGELPSRQDVAGQPPEPIRLMGSGFLNTSFNAEMRMARADELLRPLDNGPDELDCIDALGVMPEEQLVKAVKFLRTAERELAKVHDYLNDCAVFVSTENIARLSRWSETPGAPRLMAYSERGRIKIFVYQDKSDWGDSLNGLTPPDPLPAL